MPKYEVSKSWWFPQLGRKPEPGEIIELPEDVADHWMHNEPGLLKPVRMTTQGGPKVIRVRLEAPRKRAGRPRKVPVSRAKK